MRINAGLFISLFICVVTAIDPPEICERNWIKKGCFRDRITPDRPLPEQLVNHRDETSTVYDGHLINWKEWPKSLHALACRCAELTREKGYRYFGLQHYGECWSGPSHEYFRDGVSKECVGIDYEQCVDQSETECVGKEVTNYIYDTKPGNSSDISACTKKLEVGVIMDASSSVTLEVYSKMKNFIVKLTDEFEVGTECVHFGMIHYSWEAYLDFSMKEEKYWDRMTLKEKIKSINYVYGGTCYFPGGTRTDRALYKADEELFCTGCVRPGVEKVLLVLTDGKSSMESNSMSRATKGLKEKGVIIIAMGIGQNIDKNKLLEIANEKDHMFIITDINDSMKRLKSILKI